MATLTNDTANNVWVTTESVSNVGISTLLLRTGNTFVDKDISFKVEVPAASTPSFNITNKPTTNIGVETATSANGVYYYPLKASLSGVATFNNPGWIGGNRSTTATINLSDDDVIVGRIQQSTLSTTSVTPTTATQTVTIGEGYYNANRTITIRPISEAQSASATVSISGKAEKPTSENTLQSITGMQQVTIAPTSTPVTTSDGTYFISFKAIAPATTPTFTKTINKVGYLGTNSQITTSGSITANEQVFYSTITSGKVVISGSATATTPELTKVTTDGSNAGVNIAAAVTTIGTTEPTTGYYALVTAKAPSTTVSLNKDISNAGNSGWIGNLNQVVGDSVTVNEKTQNFYITIQTGTLANNSATATASATGLTLGTGTATKPSSGKYITVQGRGQIKVSKAGYLAANTTQWSTTKTYYYPVATATFSKSGNTITASTAGWVDQGQSVGTIDSGSLANTPTSGKTYTTTSSPAILTSDGYLYINSGYFTDTKISLGTLIPDSATDDVVSGVLLEGYEAFDTAGTRIIGGLTTYTGKYTWTS